MYKWLLCFRYLRTRYLAMACIVSVMLGVGTLIVGVADLHAAQNALAEAGIEAAVVDGSLRVTHDPADAARVTEILAAKGLYVNEIRHERPTLEAVFFGLTSPDVDR